MQSLLSRSVVKRPASFVRTLAPLVNSRHVSPSRGLVTDDGLKAPLRAKQEKGDDKDDKDGESKKLLHPDNVRDLSPLEIARMRVTYGLVKEHAEALEQKIDSVDAETNPMIDPRSFEIKKLPKLPPELLEQFRQELPADVAAVSRPVSTHGIWDALQTPDGGKLSAELQNERAAEWNIVDERTMDPKQYSRMQRQSLTSSGDVTFRYEAPVVMHRKKKKVCPLQDERGRVKVDFRAVGTLSSYLSESGKVVPKRRSGLSAKAQRKVSRAVKTARTMALLNPEPKPRLTLEELLEIERTLK